MLLAGISAGLPLGVYCLFIKFYFGSVSSNTQVESTVIGVLHLESLENAIVVGAVHSELLRC